jgi:two-component system OmpR family response regulator
VRILVAEDDRRLADLLDQSLGEAGWDVEVVHDGSAAYRRALPEGVPYDVLLLDWMLPEMDGVSVCRRLRSLGLTTPVLMLTARGDVRDRIDGLDAGADDYLPKPFDLDELMARLRALVRRSTYDDEAAVEVDGLVVDPGARTVSRAGTPIELSAREFDILHLLVARAGRVVTAPRSSTRSGTVRPT